MTHIIHELFAFVAEEGNGEEGVVGSSMHIPLVGRSFVPLVGADMERVESFRKIAIEIGQHSGKKITLKKFQLIEESIVYEP